MIKKDFRARRRPHEYIGHVFMASLMIALFFIISVPGIFESTPRIDGASTGKMIFTTYITSYILIIFFYFISIECDIDVQSLRRLLHDESLLWDRESSNTDRVPFFREKAKTTITALAIIIAASTLLSTRAYEALNQLNIGSGKLINSDSNWQIAMLYASIIFSCSSFILLVVAVDALDTTFNQFNGNTDKIVSYYYRHAVYPKYFGLVSVILSFVFYIASSLPEIASAAVGLLISVGYYHWFPNIYEDISTSRHFRFFVCVTICLLPIAVLIGKRVIS